jgi:hypothetical protein
MTERSLINDPSNRHMVFTVCDGYVKFQANYSRHGATNLSGSEPLAWHGESTGGLIDEISPSDMIDHLIAWFEPTTSEILWEQSNDQ